MSEVPSMLKHDKYYPTHTHPNILFAYGFRVFFYFLPIYVAVFIFFWFILFSGYFSWPFLNDIGLWHIYEFLFGFGYTAIFGFILTAIPEMFPGTKTIVGANLTKIFWVWIFGRLIGFFASLPFFNILRLIDILLPLLTLLWITPPIFKNKPKRQLGIWFGVVLLFLFQFFFLLSSLEIINNDARKILSSSLYIFIFLIVLVLRRIITELTNIQIICSHSNETFTGKPFRYNLLALSLLFYALLTLYEFDESVLFWICLSVTTTSLGVVHDFSIPNLNLWKFSSTRIFCSIFFLLAYVFGLKAYAHHSKSYNMIDLNHIITIGIFLSTISYTAIIVSHIHTGRYLKNNSHYELLIYSIQLASLLRSSPSIFNIQNDLIWLWAPTLIIISSFLFLFYRLSDILLKKRIDNQPG